MKTFLMKHDEKGKPTFLDKKDKAAFELLLSLFKDQNKIFKMTISELEKRTNEKQIKLWNVLVNLISLETGNDSQTINETLLNNFSKVDNVVSELSNQRFQDLLMFSTNFASEFLNINITLENDVFQIKKI